MSDISLSKMAQSLPIGLAKRTLALPKALNNVAKDVTALPQHLSSTLDSFVSSAVNLDKDISRFQQAAKFFKNGAVPSPGSAVVDSQVKTEEHRIGKASPADLSPSVRGRQSDFPAFEKAIEDISGIDVTIKNGKLVLESEKTIPTDYSCQESKDLVERLLKSKASLVIAGGNSIPFGLSVESERESSIYKRYGDAHIINVQSLSQVKESCPSNVDLKDASLAAYGAFGHEISEAVAEFSDPTRAFTPAHNTALTYERKYLSTMKGPTFIKEFGPQDILDGADRALNPGESAGRRYDRLKIQTLPFVKTLSK